MTEFNLENALAGISERYTAEQRADDENAHVEMIGALKPALDPNSYDQRVARARQQILSVLDQIETLLATEPSDLRKARLTQANKRLTELFVEAGRIHIAASSAIDPQQIAWLDSLIEAIDKDDDDRCKCANDRLVDRQTNQEFTAPTRTIIGEIPSAKHGRLMKIERCSKCGFLNVR